jgi:hypothetical protein
MQAIARMHVDKGTTNINNEQIIAMFQYS